MRDIYIIIGTKQRFPNENPTKKGHLVTKLEVFVLLINVMILFSSLLGFVDCFCRQIQRWVDASCSLQWSLDNMP